MFSLYANVSASIFEIPARAETERCPCLLVHCWSLPSFSGRAVEQRAFEDRAISINESTCNTRLPAVPASPLAVGAALPFSFAAGAGAAVAGLALASPEMVKPSGTYDNTMQQQPQQQQPRQQHSK